MLIEASQFEWKRASIAILGQVTLMILIQLKTALMIKKGRAVKSVKTVFICVHICWPIDKRQLEIEIATFYVFSVW